MARRRLEHAENLLQGQWDAFVEHELLDDIGCPNLFPQLVAAEYVLLDREGIDQNPCIHGAFLWNNFLNFINMDFVRSVWRYLHHQYSSSALHRCPVQISHI
jgi:hypothetical protein